MTRQSKAATGRAFEGRFHELVVRHALQTATLGEEAKLERYTKLRRTMLGNDVPIDERQEYRIRYWLKELTRFRRMDNRQKYSPVAMRPPNNQNPMRI